MNKVLSHLSPVEVKHLRTWLKLSWQSVILSVRIWPKENQFAAGFVSALVSVVVAGIVLWAGVFIITTPEVEVSSVSGRVVKVIARNGREMTPNSLEAKQILQGTYETVSVE